MGDCKYCGKSAGFLRRQHKECAATHQTAADRLAVAIEQAFSLPEPPQSLAVLLAETAAHGYISAPEQRSLLVDGWAHALERFMGDGVLDESEESRLVVFMKRFNITRDELNKSHSFDRMVKAITLREVMHGEIPDRFTFNGNLPVNLQKGEKIVWAFPRTDYLEDKTRRVYVGRSAGVSVRIAKGVYYHTSAFKGQPVERTERQHVDVGWLVLTNKNLYFTGPLKSVRIPYQKIVSFQTFSDGLGLMRDAASAKPQVFVTGDGWFTYNLAANLAKL
jgi:hypothetical protein